jgi:DNA-binding PadR family transcriptional regulator
MLILAAMRRKPESLLPIEQAICGAAASLRRRGIDEFHGYELAKQLAADTNRRLLTAYGTLYRALGRLADMGLLQSRREDPEIAARENRPGRRLYSLTPAGQAAAREVGHRPARTWAPRKRRGEAPA